MERLENFHAVTKKEPQKKDEIVGRDVRCRKNELKTILKVKRWN